MSDLKALMRAAQTERTGSVQHPAAKYNSVGKLACKLCGVVVGADSLWPAHLRSAAHVQIVDSLKRQASGSTQSARPAAPPAKPPAVAAKPTSSLPAGFFDDEAPAAVVKPTVPVVPRPTPANTKAPSPALPSSKPVLVAAPSAAKSTAPAVFAKSAASTKALAPVESSVPVGFFDDAEADAVARNTTVKDEKKRKQEEDWEAFQAFAAAVPEPADDVTPAQEDTELEREVAAADEQIGYLKRLLALHAKTAQAMPETLANASAVAPELADPEEAVSISLTSSAIVEMLRSKRARVDVPPPVPTALDEGSSSEDEPSLLDWRGRRF